MAETTAIEWTDSTWNPVTGCTRVSPGCAHCYIETTIPFRTQHRKFERVGNEEKTDLQLHPERLDPKKVPKGPRIFVNSLSDLFHEEIPAKFIFDVFETMGKLPDRTFQVLTKRPERALNWFRSFDSVRTGRVWPGEVGLDRLLGTAVAGWPLPNVWLGVSIENARYTWRADVLREILAAVRFISAEPLLGSLFEKPRITRKLGWDDGDGDPIRSGHRPLDLTGIDWLIVGGESGGKQSRPMHPEWARELRDACLALRPRDIDGPIELPAFFFKQWGSWSPAWSARIGDVCLSEDGERYDVDEGYVCAPNESDGEWMRYRGASPKSGGNLLDGRTWKEFPALGGAYALDQEPGE